MLAAAFYGALAASTLLMGGVLAYAMRPSARFTAVVMALGSGLLIGSVAYDLVGEAQLTLSAAAIATCLILGAAAFVGGSRLIAKRTNAGRANLSDQSKTPDRTNPMPIVLGSVLDGIPESFVLGLSVLHGGVSVPLLVAIGLSNLPEGLSSSAGLREQNWSRRRALTMWAIVVATSAVSAAIGYEVLAGDDGTVAGIAQTFAAGALLAMITDTMLPDAYAVERDWTGAVVVAGFALSLVLAAVLG